MRGLSDPTCKGQDDNVRLVAAGQAREPRKGRMREDMFIRSPSKLARMCVSMRECSTMFAIMFDNVPRMSHIPHKQENVSSRS